MPTSRRLYLLRHAKSSRDAPERPDFERPLSGRGRRAARAVGRLLARRGLQPDLVLCSTAARVRETWAGLASELPAEPPVRWLRSLYLATPSRLLGRIRAVEESVGTLLVVGHNPGLESLAARLAGAGSDRDALARLSEKFPTAALAGFEIASPWSAVPAQGGRLIEFTLPRELE